MREILPRWLSSVSAAVPWLTVGLLFMLVMMIDRSVTSARGVLFVLPEQSVGDVATSSVVTRLYSMPQGTLVIFDGQRYILEDDVQAGLFAGELHERAVSEQETTLLALVDVRVRHGDLLRFAGIAKRSGFGRVLFAEDHGSSSVE